MADKEIVDNPYREQSTLTTNRNLVDEVSPNVASLSVFVAKVVSVDYEKGTIGYSENISNPNYLYPTGYAKLPVFNAGKTDEDKVYGRYPSITPGQRVLIAGGNNTNFTPMVVTSYFDNQDDVKELSPQTNTDFTNNLRDVYPSGQTSSVYANGDYLRTFNGSSFFYVWLDSKVEEEGISLWDDYLYDMNGNPVISGLYQVANDYKDYDMESQSQNVAFVHNSNSDLDTHKTVFMINKFGELLVDFGDKDLTDRNLLRLTASETGGLDVTKSMDYDHENLDNSDYYLKFGITKDDTIDFKYHNGSINTGISVTKGGTYIDGVLVASRNNVENLSTDLKTLEDNFNILNDKMASLGTDFFNKLRSDITQAQNDINLLFSDVVTMSADIASNKSDISVIRGNITSIFSWQSEANNSFHDINTKISMSLIMYIDIILCNICDFLIKCLYILCSLSFICKYV